MNPRNLLLLTGLAAAVIAGGCEQKKSSNPLSPSVAGPIAGVSISAPKPLTPTPGTQIENTNQPVTLVVENASTNGQRPLTYLVEVAMDADFTNKVVSREGIAPGENGQTSFKLPEALAAERTYYWRARAQDGANTGPYSSGVHFMVFTPIVLQPPQPASPVNDIVLSDRNPTLVVSNAGRSGPVGAIIYEFQISANEVFTQIVATFEQAEQAGSTRRSLGSDLSYSTRYFWRARAWEMTKNTPGPWSATSTFKTPTAPAPPPSSPPPSPGGGSGGHVPPGPLTEGQAEKVVFATGDEFPHLLRVFSTTTQAEAAAFELLRRMIWHLQLAGFQAGRQRNPSGRVSEDKLTILIGGTWHAYDVTSVAGGRPGHVLFLEVFPANHVPDSGIPD